jgi:hypothetical protein
MKYSNFNLAEQITSSLYNMFDIMEEYCMKVSENKIKSF